MMEFLAFVGFAALMLIFIFLLIFIPIEISEYFKMKKVVDKLNDKEWQRAIDIDTLQLEVKSLQKKVKKSG